MNLDLFLMKGYVKIIKELVLACRFFSPINITAFISAKKYFFINYSASLICEKNFSSRVTTNKNIYMSIYEI